MKIGLLIINYNGADFLPVYLPSLLLQCHQYEIDIMVTDDSSTDGSVQFLKQTSCHYFVNEGVNHGFAANVNNGIRNAMEYKKFDYLIIANNDIVIPEGLFGALKKAVLFLTESDDRLGLIGFTEISSFNRQLAENFAFDLYTTETIRQVKDIPGFFFIIKTELIDQIGYLDESYFMYGEDNDYFIRTLKAGYHIYETGLPVIHFSEGSSVNAKRTSWFVYRNAFLYASKNLGIKGIIGIFFSFVNQIYNPFFKPKNPGNQRVVRNGFFYNNYLLAKSILWNIRHSYFKKHHQKK